MKRLPDHRRGLTEQLTAIFGQLAGPQQRWRHCQRAQLFQAQRGVLQRVRLQLSADPLGIGDEQIALVVLPGRSTSITPSGRIRPSTGTTANERSPVIE